MAHPVVNAAQAAPDPNCGHCQGNGQAWYDAAGHPVPFDSDDAHSATVCRCVREGAQRQRLDRIARQLPRRLRHVGLDRYPVTAMPDEHIAPARAYVAELGHRLEEGRGLWFVGPVGTGKSTVAAAIYLRAARVRVRDLDDAQEAERWGALGLQVARKDQHDRLATVAFWRFERLLDELRRTYRTDTGIDDVELQDRLKQVDLLVLDDIGAERATDWAVEKAYSILADREENGRSVIATTNLPEQELIEQIGPRVVSRLHAVTGEVVEFAGPDHRRIDAPVLGEAA